MLNRYLIWVLVFPFPVLAETGKSNYVPPPSILSTENTLQMMGGLILVLAIIAGGTWLLKRFALIPTVASGVVKVVAATGVGQRERVVVVEIENTWLVLGVAPGRVNKLHVIHKPEADTCRAVPEHSAAKAFVAQLNESINKENP